MKEYQMRRHEKEIKDPQKIVSILKSGHIVRIAMVDNGIPYIVPLNYGYEDNALYIHCARKGRKLDILKKDPHVCFEIEGKTNLITGELACKWTMEYRSLIGYGHVEILESKEEKIAGLNTLMKQFKGPINDYDPKHLDAIYILKINIESITGKESR